MAKDITNSRTRHITRAAIRRAVASSTAIETGQSIRHLEDKLRNAGNGRSRLSLAGGNPGKV